MWQWKKCSMDCSGSTVKEMWTGVGLGQACMDCRAYMVLETSCDRINAGNSGGAERS